jgi:acid phosphatase type 7
MIESFTPYVPLMISVGNHEYDHTSGGNNGKDPSGINTTNGFMPSWGNFGTDSGGECGVPTSKRFTMPQQLERIVVIDNIRQENEDEDEEREITTISKNTGNSNSSDNHTRRTTTTTTTIPPSNGVYWYSYDTGIVHTIAVSSEHDLSIGSIQHKWLQQELQYGINRTITPWVIVETHRPLYEGEINPGSNEVGIKMRYEFEDLLYTYNVDIVFSGHYHAYHRTCDRLYRSICGGTNSTDDDDRSGDSIVGSGPMHITIGTAGAHLDDSNLFDNNWTEKYINGTYGYGRVTVYNSTSLQFEFVQATTNFTDNNDDDNLVLDDVWIIRER